MAALIVFLLNLAASLFKPKSQLEAENAALRQQLIVLQRKVRGRRAPDSEWIAQQITEAFPWNEAPRYLIRDRDGIYGVAVRHRLRAMGIRDKPIAPGS